MNSQKKRNFLIAFGGVAVVLVAVVATWPPAFLSEDASGAIGVVQKHRAPQITAKDVVLVDEATRKEEAVLYGDYLKDAGKLENISVALRNRADSLEARSAAAKSTLDNVAQDLQSHSAELQSRYLGSMSEALNAASQLLARNASALSASQLESVQSDIDSLSARLKNREELASEEMESLNSRLRSVSEHLEARAAGVRSLENIEMALGSELASLEKASQLESEVQLEASAKLESLSRDLQEARSTLDARIQHRQDHLEAIALEQRSLQNAEIALEAFSRNELGNNAEISSSLESASLDLANRASQLESQALDNMQSRLKAQDEMAARIRNMDIALGSASKALKGRASGLESRFNDALGSVAQELQSRSTELQARMAARMQSELGAIESRLDSRSKLSARLQSESQLEARFASRSQLDARLRTHLGALSRALDSRSNLGATLRNQQELELQARALDARFIGETEKN